MSTASPVLVAAAPSLHAVLSALSTFVVDLGPDPTKVSLTFPPALLILLSTIELQAPVLVNSEFGVVQAAAIARIATWQANLAAAVA